MAKKPDLLRRLIWLYLFLWLVEGAVRFWILPSLSGPLALVRDPVVLVIYAVAMQRGLLPMNGYVLATMAIAGASFVATMVFGHGNLLVAIYGLRANFLHLPLVFVIGRAFTKEDMELLSRRVLQVAIPLAVIAVRQFKSPVDAPINRGGMHTHYGSVRPAGTFSFVSAMVHFMTLVAAMVAARLLRPPKTWGLLTFAASAALAVMLLVSGSRTAVVSVAVIGMLALATGLGRAQQAARLFVGLAVVGMVVAFVSNTEFAEKGSSQLSRRFEDAGNGTSLLDQTWERLSEGTLDPLMNAMDRDFFGQGLGMGTNYGGLTLAGRMGAFLVGENEWDRVLGELGIFLGLAFIFLRVALVLSMAGSAFTWGLGRGEPLVVLLFGVAWLPMLVGQWSVPALQGFAAISAGIFLAAVRHVRDTRASIPRPSPPLWSAPAIEAGPTAHKPVATTAPDTSELAAPRT